MVDPVQPTKPEVKATPALVAEVSQMVSIRPTSELDTRKLYLQTLENEDQMTKAAKAIFDKYDADSNGYLDIKELSNYMVDTQKKLGLPAPEESDIEAAFK